MKCRQAPVVAQRMIAHALCQKVQNTTETVASTESRGKQLSNGKNIPTHSRNNFCPVTPDNREAVRNGSQTQLVVTRIKLHQTKGATQLMLELLLLKAWRKSRLEQLKECLHMRWGCLQLEEVTVHCPNRSKDLELRMRISGEGCQLPMQAPTELPVMYAVGWACNGWCSFVPSTSVKRFLWCGSRWKGLLVGC